VRGSSGRAPSLGTVADVGKLLVWSFLAGYSERFVTGILSTLEQKSPDDRTQR